MSLRYYWLSFTPYNTSSNAGPIIVRTTADSEAATTDPFQRHHQRRGQRERPATGPQRAAAERLPRHEVRRREALVGLLPRVLLLPHLNTSSGPSVTRLGDI